MGAEIIRRQGAARRRAHGAAMGSMQHISAKLEGAGALAADPILLHGEMRKRIAAIEETLAKLPPAPEGPLNDNEIEEINSEIATLKTLPPVPTQPPTDAIKAESKWRERGEKVLVGLATGLATSAVSEASKALWARCGDQLIDAANALGAWIASLPPPP
jgi:hypothetical protein